MAGVRIGRWSEGGVAELNIEHLLASRGLVCANSGGGKSYGLRRIVESLQNRVQQIIIDTDGEFASLREKFDFVVCAAHGGDALAHPKTAALLCRRLLETKVSAVIDIQDLKQHDRHLFVKIFIETLMELPKTLWSPLVLHLDEAHIYCPEKGFGESIASDAVIDLASRGRKRGYCLVAATQRMAKFRKDAAAELLNKFIGRTGLDLDVKRAAFELGMTPKEAQATLPHLDHVFYAYGPAISKQVKAMAFDKVETSHPQAGVARVKALPKPTAAITAVLPQLADLPKEAEREAKTLKDLQDTIAAQKRAMATIERELAHAKTVALVAKPDTKKTTEMNSAIHDLRAKVRTRDRTIVELSRLAGEGHKWMHRVAGDAQTYAEGVAATATRYREFVDPKLVKILATLGEELEVRPDLVQQILDKTAMVANVTPTPRPARVTASPPDGTTLPAVQQRILDGLAWLAHKGIENPTRPMLSAVAKSRGGYYTNTLGAMNTAGLIRSGGGTVSLTDEGAQRASQPEDDGRELWEHWMDVMEGVQKRILKALLDRGEPMTRDELSESASVRGGYYTNTLGAMKTMGAIDYPQNGMVAVTKNVVP
jgi:uncharacterized protein